MNAWGQLYESVYAVFSQEKSNVLKGKVKTSHISSSEMFYYWPMYRTFLLTHPYMMVAEDSYLELDKYQKMGLGSRITANVVGVPLGLAIGATLWGAAIAMLAFAYACLGMINSVLMLTLIVIYSIMLPALMITYAIANIISDLFHLIRPRNGIQPNHDDTRSRHRG